MTEDQVGYRGGRDARTDGDTMSLAQMLVVVLRNRRLILALALGAAIIVVLMTLLQERRYVASATFVPQRATSRSGSQALGLARQFGIDLGGSAAMDQSPQFYASLVRSREILKSAVLTEYAVPGEDGEPGRTLVELWRVEPRGVVPAWHVAVEELRDDLRAVFDRETDMVTVSVSARSPDLAEAIVGRLVELVNEFNLEMRQSQAAMERDFAAERLQEARTELAVAEDSLKRFLESNRAFRNAPDLVFEHDRLQRALALRQEVLSSIAQMLEQARIERVRNLPLISMVAAPEGSARPQGRGTLLRGILALIGGAFLGLVIAFARHGLAAGEAGEGDAWRELRRLRTEVGRELRNPLRLFAGARSGAPR